MKKLPPLLTCLLFISVVYAQKFPAKSSEWYYTNGGGTAPAYSYLYIYRYEKDTLVNGIMSRKMNNGLVFYTSNDSVYYLNTLKGNFGLLYVFTAKVGDTIPVAAPYNSAGVNHTINMVVDSVGTEIHSSVSFTKFHVHSLDPDLHFSNDQYMSAAGAEYFFPVPYSMIPEADFLKCYVDSSTEINYSAIPCDSATWYGIGAYNSLSGLILFPNPAYHSLTINGNFRDPFQIEFSDASGRLVMRQAVVLPGEAIDVSKLSPGLYLISLTTELGSRHSLRFIKN